MVRTLKTLALAFAAGLLGAAGASASTIDLTDAGSYTAGASSANGTVDGVAWEITPVPNSAILTYTPYDGTGTAVGAPLAFEIDGIGIGQGDDEVTHPTETLVMTFDEEVDVLGIYVLDLFGDETVTIYDQNNVQIALITATSPSGNNSVGGYTYYAFAAATPVTSLTFVPGNGNDNAGNPDFAMAGIELAAIPVPAAGLLLLGALGMLGLARRRKAA